MPTQKLQPILNKSTDNISSKEKIENITVNTNVKKALNALLEETLKDFTISSQFTVKIGFPFVLIWKNIQNNNSDVCVYCYNGENNQFEPNVLK